MSERGTTTARDFQLRSQTIYIQIVKAEKARLLRPMNISPVYIMPVHVCNDDSQCQYCAWEIEARLHTLSLDFHTSASNMRKTRLMSALYRNIRYTTVAAENLRCQNRLISAVNVSVKSNHSSTRCGT